MVRKWPSIWASMQLYSGVGLNVRNLDDRCRSSSSAAGAAGRIGFDRRPVRYSEEIAAEAVGDRPIEAVAVAR